MSIEKTVALFDRPVNRKLSDALKEQNVGVITVPMPQILGCENSFDDKKQMEKINDFDWIVFPDIWTVDALLEKLAASDFDLFELDRVRVCACGESVADRLRFDQLHADVIPPVRSPEIVFRSIKDYAGKIDRLKFLVLNGEGGDWPLGAMLEKENAVVTELGVYRFDFSGELAKLRALIGGGAIDEFYLATAEDVFAFVRLFGGSVQSDLKLIGLDEITRQTIKELDL